MSFIGLFVPLHPCVSRVVINSSLDKRSNYTFIFVDVVAFFFFCHLFPRRFKAYYSLFLLFLSSHPFLVFFNLQFDGKVFVWVSNYACYIVTEANVEELGSNICKVLDSL